MTSTYPEGDRPIGQPHTKESPSKEFTELHKLIGTKACNYVANQFLPEIHLQQGFSQGSSKSLFTDPIIQKSYRNLLGELTQVESEPYEELNIKGLDLLQNPDFKTGFERMQKFFTGLGGFISKPPFDGAIRNSFRIADFEIERPILKASFEKDPRCLEIAKLIIDSVSKKDTQEEAEIKSAQGSKFAYFIFYNAVMNYTEAELDALAAVSPKSRVLTKKAP